MADDGPKSARIKFGQSADCPVAAHLDAFCPGCRQVKQVYLRKLKSTRAHDAARPRSELAVWDG
jgi:phage FluMu protein Com